MFIHAVYFWLKPDLTDAQRAEFVQRGQALTTLASVHSGWFGTPADTDRPVIDRSYSYGLVVVLEDSAAHDAYQVDPIHDAFRELAPMWTAVKIYDFET